MNKKIIALGVFAFAVVAGLIIARYFYIHRFDDLFLLNRRSGIVHNFRCSHFRKGQPSDYLKLEDLKHPKLRDCRICGGRTIKALK